MVYFCLAITYTQYIASIQQGNSQFELSQEVLLTVGAPFALFWLYFSYQEVRQFKANFQNDQIKAKKSCCKKFCMALTEHYARGWNYIDTYMML